VVISPTGTNPDNWLTNGFCAWHDYNGDSTLSGGGVTSPYGDIAFTNLPYITDAGASCGQNFVNSSGTLDGVSIVEGHEYAETITDQNPAGGYTDSAGSENGDKCAWITPGTSGGSFDLTTSTGTFAMQTTWANDGAGGAGSCEASHPIVTNGGGGTNTVTVTNPGNQTGTAGTAVNLQISASDSASGQTLTYTATGLPAGLSISSSGLISGTPTTAATSTVTVTATDTTGAKGSVSFTWTISSAGGGGGNAVVNGGFESGTLSSWTASGPANTVTTSTPHSGTYAALLGSSTTPTNGASSIAATFTAKTGNTHLTFWYKVACPDTVTYDWATATLRDNTTATTSTVLPHTCTNTGAWVQVSVTITAGHSYTLTLTSEDDNYPGDPTATEYDDVATS
jgi:serine protease